MNDTQSNRLLIVIVLAFIVVMCWLLTIDYRKQEDSITEKERYEKQSIPRFNTLKRPVILIGKTKIGDRYYDIVVKDSNSIFETFTSDCTLANSIGSSKNVGDTLK